MAKINSNELKQAFKLLKDENNIEELYKKYNNIVYGIVFSIIKNKEEAEDITEQVFVKIYEMDKSKLPTKNEASWLYTVSRNETMDFLRKLKVSQNIEEYEIEDENDEISKIVDIEYYNKIISVLNDTDKKIVSLKILSDLSFDEISNLLDIPSGTVKWRYYKAVSSLKMIINSLALTIITFVIGLNVDKEQKYPDITVEQTPITSIGEGTSYTQNVNFWWIISGVFLVIMIIFLIIFIKNQLKVNKKTSK